MLSLDQRAEFNAHGFVRISSAFDTEAARQMQQRVWEFLGEKYGVAESKRSTWGKIKGVLSSLQELKSEPPFAKIGSDKTLSCIDSILGRGRWRKPKTWGQFLVTFPTISEWVVPTQTWHTDFGFAKPPPGAFGAIMFSFIREVGEHSGGTAVIAGSHRLVHRFVEQQPAESLTKMKAVRKAFFASDPWLKDLCTNSDEEPCSRNRRFMANGHEISGIPVQVTELTGEPGDIVPGHPWLMHTSAMNCGENPRMMCVQRIDKI